MYKDNPPSIKFARLRTQSTDIPVASNAAFDLKHLDEMRRKGTPISTTIHDNMYYEGTTNATFDLPFEQHRGVDINDAWNHSKRVKSALSKAKVKDFNLNPSQV